VTEICLHFEIDRSIAYDEAKHAIICFERKVCEYFLCVKNRRMLDDLVEALMSRYSLTGRDSKEIYDVQFPQDGYIKSDTVI